MAGHGRRLMLQSQTVLVSHGSGGLQAGPVPVWRQLREDFRDLPTSSSFPAWRRKRSNFSYIFKLLLIVAEVAVLRQPRARQNPTAQDLVLAKVSRTKDKPKMCVGTDAPCYSPVFLFKTPQQGVGGRGSQMREGGFALGSDPKTWEDCAQPRRAAGLSLNPWVPLVPPAAYDPGTALQRSKQGQSASSSGMCQTISVPLTQSWKEQIPAKLRDAGAVRSISWCQMGT